MKKILFLLALVLLSSCSITERLIILPNEEVKIAHEIDMSQMLVMAKSMGDGGDTEDLSNKKKQDTVFSFKSILEEKKDSIALLPMDEQIKLLALEKYHFKMEMDESQDQFLMTIFADFSSIDEFKNVMAFDEVLNNSNVNPLGGKKLPSNLAAYNLKTTYNFDGQVFKRTSIKNEVPESNQEKTEAFDPENPDMSQVLEMAKEMPIEMTYKLNYRFAKRIRSTSVKNAKISADRLMVDFEFDMKTYETDPEFLNLEIYFE